MRDVQKINRDEANLILGEKLFHKVGAMTEKSHLLEPIKHSSVIARPLLVLADLMGQEDVSPSDNLAPFYEQF